MAAEESDAHLLVRKKRWRLALGVDAEDQSDRDGPGFSKEEQKMDQILEQLYPSDRTGGQGKSKPVSAKWFGEVRTLFPPQIVRLLQKDAIERFGIKKLLSQSAILEQVEPDVGLIADILSVKEALVGPSLEEAKNLIRRLARSVEERLSWQLKTRLAGSKQPGKRMINPRQADIDWNLTIRQNLKHYQPDLKTIIPQRILGRPRHSKSLKNLILLVDQSASMTESMVYASILGGVLASIRSLETRFIAFDTSVVDLTEYLRDSVDLLFEVQLGGGTDIQQAIAYARQIINPEIETHVILITDLYEGAPEELLFEQCQFLLNQSVQIIVLLALDEKGRPAYDQGIADRLTRMAIPCFACTPEKFPEVMAATLNKEDLSRFV